MAFLLQLLRGLTLTLGSYVNYSSVLFLGCVLLLSYWFVSSRGWPNCPPGPWGWPVLGNLPSLGQYSYETLEALGRRYGDVFRIKLGSRDVVVLNSVTAIHEALVKKAADFSSRPHLFWHEARGGNKHGIGFVPYGPFWKQQRKFAITSLRDFGFGKRSMEGKVSAEAEKLTVFIFKTEGEAFDAKTMILSAVANVIFSVVVGEPFDYKDPKFRNYLTFVEDFTSRGMWGQLPDFIPATKHLPVVKRQVKVEQTSQHLLNDFYQKFVTKHKAMFDESDIRDFVDAFLLESKRREEEEGSTFTDKQLEQSIGSLLGAGTETTATTLRWALLYMMLHPDIQHKVQQEIDTAAGRDRLPSLADREQLPYTQAVIAEVMRIRPVLPLSVPHATSHATTLRGYDIPADTMVLPNLWAVMHDPEQYPEPDVFKPGRFLDDSGRFVKPATFIPFSTGRRACLGERLARMELFIFFTHLMYHFTFKVPEGAATPSTKGTFGLVLSPPKFQMCAAPRK